MFLKKNGWKKSVVILMVLGLFLAFGSFVTPGTASAESPGAPPALTADTTENIVGQPVEITFSDGAAWSTAISSILVGGKELATQQYTVSGDKITLVVGTFTNTGSYEVVVKAAGYTDAVVTQIIDISVKVTGNGVTTSTTFTLADLEAMKDTADWVEARLYSSINTWPTKKWYAAEGVKLTKLLTEAGIKDEAKLITVKARDGYKMTFTKKELLEDTRYYFPGLKANHEYFGQIPGSTVGAEPVDVILAVRSVDSDNLEGMNTLNSPLLVFGQRWVTEQTNQAFAKYVSEIEVSLTDPGKWDAPTATPSGGIVLAGTLVELSNLGMDADKVYYTTDGSDPTYESPIYNWIAFRWWGSRSDDLDEVNHPIEITGNTIIKAKTIGIGKEDSDIVTFNYQVLVDPAPALVADTTDNTVGNSIDLTFEDNEAWRNAIAGITVNDSAVTSDKYTAAAGKLTIDASVFAAAGDYTVVVKATGYEDATVTQQIKEAAVSVTYAVTFAVKDGEDAVEGATIVVKKGEEVITPEIDGAYELEAGDYSYTVTKEGYKEATGNFTVASEAVAINVTLEKEAAGKTPPALTASASGNTVGNSIEIKYTDTSPASWGPAVTTVIVDGMELESGQYNIASGRLTIIAGIFNEIKDYIVTVKATGYQNATVTQKIEARPVHFVSEGKGNMVYVAGKNAHTIALKNDGTLWAWGDGQQGKFGDGTTGSSNWRSVPGPVSDLTEITAVAPGYSHNLALKSDGTVWAWGNNMYGQLGDGSNTASTVPVQVITDPETGVALTDVQAIATGDGYSVALKNDGTVWAWGTCSNGKLGNGSTSGKSAVPVQVMIDADAGTALMDVKAIAAFKEHSAALKNDGTVWTWGRNNYGQLGNGLSGSTEKSAVAVQVMMDSAAGTALTDIRSISAGSGHTFAIKSDGTAWGWGANYNGQMGIGSGDTVDGSVPVPVQVTRLTDVKAIAPGEGHVLALENNGTLWAWGSNLYGQLGIGVHSKVPAQLYVASDIAMINAGHDYSLAVKNDGTVWAWGNNTKGKLGDGATVQYPENRFVPTQVKLAPQAVVPDAEPAILGEAVELVFSDETVWREAITGISVEGTDLAGDKYTVAAGKITIAADVFTEANEYTITVKADGFLDATVTQQVRPKPQYKVVPVADDVYTIGETDGFKTLTIKEEQTGFKYFTVAIEPIQAHEGKETVVFTHLRNGVQLQLNASVADFDVVNTAKAGFNVQTGDVVKIFIVDQLTNDPGCNPVIFQQ